MLAYQLAISNYMLVTYCSQVNQQSPNICQQRFQHNLRNAAPSITKELI